MRTQKAPFRVPQHINLSLVLILLSIGLTACSDYNLSGSKKKNEAPASGGTSNPPVAEAPGGDSTTTPPASTDSTVTITDVSSTMASRQYRVVLLDEEVTATTIPASSENYKVVFDNPGQ